MGARIGVAPFTHNHSRGTIYHLGIDLHKHESHVTVLDDDAEVVEEIRVVALAAFEASRHVHFVDFDRSGQRDRRRVERFARALDAPAHPSVGKIEFGLNPSNTRVEV